MRKRPTKQQREDAERAALYRRVEDIYSGALGSKWPEEDEFATADLLSRVMPTLRDFFQCEESGRNNSHMFSPYCLQYFDNPRTATDALYENGVRA